MKVAFSVEHIDPSRGGAETYMHGLAVRLVQDGHEVHVFARDLPAALPLGVVGHVVRPRGLTQAARARHYVVASEVALALHQFDVVHATNRTLTMDVLQPHGGTVRGSMAANLARLGPWPRRLRHLLWLLSPRRQAFLDIERRQFARAGHLEVIAVSRLVRDHLERYYGVPPDRVTVVYNGVDVERLQPATGEARFAARVRYRLPPSDVVVLLVAHNPRLKGLAELIEAVGQARRQGAPIRLMAVGRFNPRPFLRLARRHGLADRVTFPGSVPDPATAYAAADVYAQPTYYDPCSLTVLEAWAAGLPVITTRQNGASELMTRDREGVVMDSPRDGRALVAALLAFCDAERRAAAGQAARALACRHSTEHNYREILAVYRRVMERKR